MTGEAVWLLGLLLALQCKHLAADFLFQTRYMLVHKGTYGHPGGLLHAGVHGTLSLGILMLMGVPPWPALALSAAETLVHYHLDWGKERWNRRRAVTPTDARYWYAVGTDQWLHQLTYLAMAVVALGRAV